MSRKKSTETFNEFIVGVFMTAVLLLLAYFTIVISGVDVFRGNKRVQITVAFDQVGGLKDHDNVMFRGTKVGSVEEVKVLPDHLEVVALIDRNVVLRENYTISVNALSMLGGNYLLLEEGTGAPIDLATAELKGETPTDWMRDVAVVASRVREIADSGELHSIVTNISSVTSKADSFMDKANRAADEVEKAVADARALLEKASGAVDTASASIESATASFNSTADKISDTAVAFKETAARANSVLEKVDRQQMFDDLEVTIANFRKATDGVDGHELMAGATNVMAKAELLLANLNDVSEKLKNGEGTLGKLVNDPTLYNEVQGAIKDARQVLDNFRDTTPISTFSSLATGAL